MPWNRIDYADLAMGWAADLKRREHEREERTARATELRKWVEKNFQRLPVETPTPDLICLLPGCGSPLPAELIESDEPYCSDCSYERVGQHYEWGPDSHESFGARPKRERMVEKRDLKEHSFPPLMDYAIRWVCSWWGPEVPMQQWNAIPRAVIAGAKAIREFDSSRPVLKVRSA